MRAKYYEICFDVKLMQGTKCDCKKCEGKSRNIYQITIRQLVDVKSSRHLVAKSSRQDVESSKH